MATFFVVIAFANGLGVIHGRLGVEQEQTTESLTTAEVEQSDVISHATSNLRLQVMCTVSQS